jgi:ubiquinone/menaquinone biosynthesis C-methylase UbiE
MNQLYPLKSSVDEFDRLDRQAALLDDPSLEDLLANKKSVLELGCGSASNYPAIKATNSTIKYTGVDICHKSIFKAKQNYQEGQFILSDITSLNVAIGRYDMVFIKLVLWSIPKWRCVLENLANFLKPGGVVYIFEPFNQGLLFYPEIGNFKKVCIKWDKTVIEKGLEPNIGPKIAAQLYEFGFNKVQVTPFNVSSFYNQRHYQALKENLRTFYLTNSDIYIPTRLLTRAHDELDSHKGVIMDTFFVTTAIFDK